MEHILIVEDEAESKLRTFTKLGLDTNVSLILVDNVLTDDEAETNSLSIQLPRGINDSKQFE